MAKSSIFVDTCYRLHEQLGPGGMGADYCAYDRLNATEVVLEQVNIPIEFLEFMSGCQVGLSLS